MNIKNIIKKAAPVLLALPALGLALPGGSYLQSCRYMHFESGRLTGQCQRADGSWNHVSHRPANCVFYKNVNGSLICKVKAHRRSYQTMNVRVGPRPLYNQAQASRRCPRICGKANSGWNGQWSSTNGNSVCGCRHIVG